MQSSSDVVFHFYSQRVSPSHLSFLPSFSFSPHPSSSSSTTSSFLLPPPPSANSPPHPSSPSSVSKPPSLATTQEKTQEIREAKQREIARAREKTQLKKNIEKQTRRMTNLPQDILQQIFEQLALPTYAETLLSAGPKTVLVPRAPLNPTPSSPSSSSSANPSSSSVVNPFLSALLPSSSGASHTADGGEGDGEGDEDEEEKSASTSGSSSSTEAAGPPPKPLDTLKQCSLVCRSWLSEARRHIHRTLILAMPEQPPPSSHPSSSSYPSSSSTTNIDGHAHEPTSYHLSALHARQLQNAERFKERCRFLVEEAPYLAGYVRECVVRGTRSGQVYLDYDYDDDSPTANPDGDDEHIRALNRTKTLRTLFHLLTSLRSLHLERLDYQTHSHTLQACIPLLCRASKLVELRMSWVRFRTYGEFVGVVESGCLNDEEEEGGDDERGGEERGYGEEFGGEVGYAGGYGEEGEVGYGAGYGGYGGTRRRRSVGGGAGAGVGGSLRKLEVLDCEVVEEESISILDARAFPTSSSSFASSSSGFPTYPSSFPSSSSHQQNTKTYLTHLHIAGPFHTFLIAYLLHPHAKLSIKKLPRLDVQTPVSSGFESTNGLLMGVGGALEELRFEFSGSIAHDFDRLQLIHNPNLKTLHLRGGSGRSAMFAGNTAVWAQALLTTITQSANPPSSSHPPSSISSSSHTSSLSSSTTSSSPRGSSPPSSPSPSSSYLSSQPQPDLNHGQPHITEPTPCLLLSSISITMRMDFIPLRGTHTPRWTEIQSLLMNPPSASFFSHLKQLNIRIVTSMDVKRNPIIGFVAGEMEGMMSGLGERGVLRVWMESEVGRGGEGDDDEEEQEEGEAVDWA